MCRLWLPRAPAGAVSMPTLGGGASVYLYFRLRHRAPVCAVGGRTAWWFLSPEVPPPHGADRPYRGHECAAHIAKKTAFCRTFLPSGSLCYRTLVWRAPV